MIDPARLPSEPSLVVPITIYYFDTDAAGVVHNVAYLRLVEVARTELARHLGWTLEEMRDTGLVPVVARTEIDYLKPSKLGDSLEIYASLAKMEKVRFYLDFTITRPSDGALIARCRQMMATVLLSAGRPQPAPEAWAQAYPRLTQG